MKNIICKHIFLAIFSLFFVVSCCANDSGCAKSGCAKSGCNKEAKACAKKNISLKTLEKKEKECLTNLRKYDEGKVSLTKTLSSVMPYDEITGGNGKLEESYRRTLLDKPWQSCPCRICKDTGIDIVIFRRNNRNRRRGFHNTWMYYRAFNPITKSK